MRPTGATIQALVDLAQGSQQGLKRDQFPRIRARAEIGQTEIVLGGNESGGNGFRKTIRFNQVLLLPAL
jgi:hypothetical protein